MFYKHIKCTFYSKKYSIQTIMLWLQNDCFFDGFLEITLRYKIYLRALTEMSLPPQNIEIEFSKYFFKHFKFTRINPVLFE